jgi:hypothetical protein
MEGCSMPKYARGPYNFDGCYICATARRAESKGISLSEKELIEAFAVQAERSKSPNTVSAEERVKKRKDNEKSR